MSFFEGHSAKLAQAGFWEILLLQIGVFWNHYFTGSPTSTYFRYRTSHGRMRVTVIFSQEEIEVTDLEEERRGTAS